MYNQTMIRIDYIRDGLIDEFHEGYVVKYSEPANENTSPYYLRSCAKPLQASLLVDYEIELTPQETALCCGSHSGEDCHIRIANQIMNKFGLKVENLKCGIHSPLSRSAQDKMLLRGEKPTALHNNCSGKHLGFLAICKKMNWDIQTYDEPTHPLQKAIKNKIYEMCKVTSEYPMTTDGCGVPILSMPLYNILEGFISLLNYPNIIYSIKENPYIFGGEGRLDTEIIQHSENLIAKVGAGGLCVVLNIKEKDAFIVKINDCSMEARKIAVLELINKYGWGNMEYDKNIKTINGKTVGKIEFHHYD